MVEHLERKVIIEQGSFYTPKKIVDLVYQLIKKNSIKFDYVCDTSAGYGDFILPTNKDKFIYVDIDQQALDTCQKRHGRIFKYLCANALKNLDRTKLQIPTSSKLLIIGNPPYNDRTSFYRKHQKGTVLIDEELWNRDIGISFLKSFVQLKADYVCILHPLSYLVKETKFRSLKKFKDNYVLIDGLVISSRHFAFTSQNTHFPILIGIYQRSNHGMTFTQIKTFPFRIYEKKCSFFIDQFFYIEQFHTKYKNKKTLTPYQHFFTLRDMNHLMINRSWLKEETNSSIRVTKKNIFIFLDKLKKWFTSCQNEYYFLGNLSPIIFNDWINKDILTKLTDQQFSERFEKELSANELPWKAKLGSEKLIWRFNNVSAGGKYRFKLRNQLTDYGDPVSSATKTVSENCFLEVQVAYDKSSKDFWEKPALQKISFHNHKKEKRFFFELSDMLYWTVWNGWITKTLLKDKLSKLNEDVLLDKEFQVGIKEAENKYLLNELNFIQSDIVKPRLICSSLDNGFIEIKIDKRQKAVGDQAMVFYYISANSLTMKGKSVVGQTVKKKDWLEYAMNRNIASDIFTKLVIIFLHLSNTHQKDMQAIIKTILATKD